MIERRTPCLGSTRTRSGLQHQGIGDLAIAGDGPERIHGDWWRRDGEIWAVRDYWRVEDEKGERFWMFRRGDGVDAATGDLSWYMHGLFG